MQEFVLAFAGSFCAGLLFNVRGWKLTFTGISGMLGWIVYTWLLDSTGHTIPAIFAGALAVGVFSESAARLLKSPSTIFSIPGIFPIVPGIAAYQTIQYVAENKLPQAGGMMVETLAGAGAIAFGIILITAAFRYLPSRKKV